jgi:hypothetical protein
MRAVMLNRLFARGARVRAGLALIAVASFAGCTQVQQQGVASSYLILNSIQAASGAKPASFSGVLDSDVLTLVKKTVDEVETLVPTIFDDLGQVTFKLALKDPGSAEHAATPSTTNYITVTRYHVDYIRADGRSTQGIDVPYSFDGAFTITVGDTPVTASFNLVRIQSKEESPLRALVGGGGSNVISTIARITFYGRDQAGREVSVTGQIGINFADWGDPS